MDPCPPPNCEPCKPCVVHTEPLCVSRKALLDVKKEHIQPTPDCGIENCKVLGHLDKPYRGEAFKNRFKYVANTLGSPVGLIHSSTVVQSDVMSNRLIMERFGAMLKAFAKVFILEESKWQNQTIDNIIKEGENLFLDSLDGEDPGEFETGVPQIESELKVKREFDSDHTLFHVELEPKFQGIYNGKRIFHEPEIDSVDGQLYEGGGDLPLANLRKVLRDFFKDAKFGFIHFKYTHLLVWKANNIFFVLDFFGRQLNNLKSDYEGNGFATMLALKSLDNVLWLITGLSNMQPTDLFSIREVRMVRFARPDGPVVTRTFGKRKNDWEIIRNDYGILRSNLHVSLNRANVFRNRAALPVGIAAVLASKIDHVATWSTPDFDKIMCYGFNVCRECVDQCMNGSEPINLSNLPDILRMGQFLIKYKLEPSKYQGIWKCVPYLKQGQLYGALKQAFDDGETAVLLQISFQMYTIIKKKNFYYLLDPYLHKVKGVTDSVAEDPKSATIRMFCHFDTMMEVLHEILLQNTRTNRFFLHTLKVTKIVLKDQSEKLDDCEDECDGQNNVDEVASLNEYICFDIDDRKCLDEFGQPTDFEEEEEEIPWSEYEEEEMPGEEEEGAPPREAVLALERMDEGGEGEDGGKGGRGGKRRRKKGKRKSSAGAGGPEGPGETKEAKEKKEKEKKEKSAKGDEGEKGDQAAEKKKSAVDGGAGAAAGGPESGFKGKFPTKPGLKKEEAQADKKGATKGADGKATKPGEAKKAGDDAKKGEKTEQQKKADKKALRSELQKAKMNKDKLSGCFADRLQARDEDLKHALETLQKKVCKPKEEKKKYPSYSPTPHDLCVVGSECGTYEDICRSIRNSFRCSDRILLIVPWGNYVIFETVYNINRKMYYLFSGCTCDINRFRYIDLSCGTEGLVPFTNLHDLITYIIDSCAIRESVQQSRKRLLEDVCCQFDD